MNEIISMFIENPEGTSDTIVKYLDEYRPLMYKLFNTLYGFYKDYVNNEEVYAYDAKYKMSYYQALINAGFTEDQAFTLLLDRQNRRDNALNNFTKSVKAAYHKE